MSVSMEPGNDSSMEISDGTQGLFDQQTQNNDSPAMEALEAAKVATALEGATPGKAEGEKVLLVDRGGVSKDRLAFEQLGTREVDRLFH